MLVGNFGVGNLGDEALQEYFLKAFPEIVWTVVSAHPKAVNEVPRLPFGFRSLFSPWWRTIAAYRSVDACVFGGGSLLTDVESITACRLWWWHARVARFFKKPVLLAFQGIGPFRTKKGEMYARLVVIQSAFVSVRDEASSRRIQAWDTNKKVVQSFDPVFSLLYASKRDQSTKNVLAIFPRDSWDESFVQAVRQACANSAPEEILFLLMRPTCEREIAERLKEELHIPSASLVALHSLDDLLHALAPVRRVLTQRYHGAIAGLALGKEVVIVPQVPGDKLDELKDISLRDSVDSLLALVTHGEQELRMALKSIA